MSPLEIIAAIFIALGVIKLVVLSVSPKSWFNFAKKVHSQPSVTAFVALVLGGVILYYLVEAGITIIDIFAVMLFLGMVILTGMTFYAKDLIRWVEKKGFHNIMKTQWLSCLIWVLLLIWGIKELFF